MKSKISFFNSVIFTKNLKLFWPIWLVYFVLLAVWMPCRIALEFWQAKDNMILYGYDAKQEFIRIINNSLDTNNHIMAIAGVAIVVAIAMFYYLLSGKAANMFHAFPVNRTELYGTGVISGISFIWIPQILVFVISLLICIGYGSTNVKYLGLWLVMMMGLSFFEYALAVVAVMCTGQILGAPFVFAAFNFAYYVLRLAVADSIEFFAFGLTNISDLKYGKINWLSPLVYMLTNVSFGYEYDDTTNNIKGLTCSGTGAAVGFFAAGVVIFLLGLWLYKKRNIESAGDLAAFQFFKPVFRWGMGIVGGLLVCVLFQSIMRSVGRTFYDCYFFVCTIAFGSIIFALMDMLVQKSFRIINKRRIKEFCCFVVATFVACGLINLAGGYYENMIPEKENVNRSFISFDYPVEINMYELEKVMDVQREIVRQKQSFKKVKSTYESYIRFKYYLKNGEIVERAYNIPYTDQSIKNILSPLYEVENSSAKLNDYLLGQGNEDAYEYSVGGYMTVTDDSAGRSDNINITDEQAKIIFEGVKKEINEGILCDLYSSNPESLSLMKYDDGTFIVQQPASNNYNFYLTLNFKCDDFKKYSDAYIEMEDINWRESFDKNPTNYSYYGMTSSYYNNELVKDFHFNDNCKYIIQAIIDSGLVSDVEELRQIPQGLK